MASQKNRAGNFYENDFERFRGWVPSLTNPRRVNKLTKFFGQEPPLLNIFLKKLGYEVSKIYILPSLPFPINENSALIN